MNRKELRLPLFLVSVVIAWTFTACTTETVQTSVLPDSGGSSSPAITSPEVSPPDDTADSSPSVEVSASPEVAPSNDAADVNPSIEVTVSPEPVGPVDASSGELSSDIRSHQCELGGVVYTFPVESVQQFLDNGWSTDKALDFSLPANTRTSGYTFKDSEGHRMVLTFLNSSDATKDVMDCYVESISLSQSAYILTGANITLPGGFQIGSSYDDIIAACGEADKRRDVEGVSTFTLTYGESYNEVVLTINKDTNTLIEVYITYSDLIK